MEVKPQDELWSARQSDVALSRQIMNEKAKCCGSKNSLKPDFSDVAAECWEFWLFLKEREVFLDLTGIFRNMTF